MQLPHPGSLALVPSFHPSTIPLKESLHWLGCVQPKVLDHFCLVTARLSPHLDVSCVNLPVCTILDDLLVVVHCTRQLETLRVIAKSD
jgi:hypothetical protein